MKHLYYQSAHYNLKYKTGALLNRVTVHDVCGIRPQDIERIWIVEESRNATPEEIRKLCKPSKQPIRDWQWLAIVAWFDYDELNRA